MPEQLTKHPEVTLEVLKSGPASCGTGAPQEILKSCPKDRFCKLPGGEMCIYGLPEATKMTQVTQAEWRAIVPPLPATPPEPSMVPVAVALAAGLLVGFVVAWWLRRP
ncbi:MAG: hypothetical protein HY854_04700 [Burkholderiales bacterium]|nr:hypothetical protein [Burkholderiales bacterium]